MLMCYVTINTFIYMLLLIGLTFLTHPLSQTMLHTVSRKHVVQPGNRSKTFGTVVSLNVPWPNWNIPPTVYKYVCRFAKNIVKLRYMHVMSHFIKTTLKYTIILLSSYICLFKWAGLVCFKPIKLESTLSLTFSPYFELTIYHLVICQAHLMVLRTNNRSRWNREPARDSHDTVVVTHCHTFPQALELWHTNPP